MASVETTERLRYVDSNPYDCFKADEQIKNLDTRISNLSIGAISGLSNHNQTVLRALKAIRLEKKIRFAQQNCISKIELKKLVESKNIIVDNFENYDDDVLIKSNKTTNKLLIIGGLSILIALYLIVKKK